MKGLNYCLALSILWSSCQQGNNSVQYSISPADTIAVQELEQKSIDQEQRNPDSALYFAHKGLQLSRALEYKLGEGHMLTRLAHIHKRYGSWDIATKYEQKALTIFSATHDSVGIATTFISLGTLAEKRGYYAKGVNYIQKALGLYQRLTDTSGIITSYIHLGKMSAANHDRIAALRYYTRAKQYYKKATSAQSFDIVHGIAMLHFSKDNHLAALDTYKRALTEGTRQYQPVHHIALLNHTGRTLDSLGEKEQALAYYQSALQQAKSQGLHEGMARSLLGMSRVAKDDNQSVVHLTRALAIAKRIGNKQLSSEIYRSLATLYQQQSRHQDALVALEKHHHILDSLSEANNRQALAVVQKSYELAESRLRAETLTVFSREKINQRNISLLSAGAVLIILMILIIDFFSMRRLNANLLASNRIKDKLFSIIGHDLRNPISSISQMLLIMEEGGVDGEESRAMLTEMRKQSWATLEILTALLQWGQSQLKGVSVHQTIFNAKDSIRKNMEALNAQAAAKQIIIDDNTSGSVKIYGDINHFEFIVRNLLSNAIKFSYPKGHIEINAQNVDDSNEVRFTVKDWGKGISAPQRQQFRKSTLEVSFGTTGEKGTGIGLMLCKEFIKANHGRIWVESEEGKGATFYFTFMRTP